MHVHLRGRKPPPDGYPTAPQTVGEHIRKRRMDLGLRQRDVAELLSCSTATVLGWEALGRQPRVSQWPAIIDFLGYDPHPEPRDFARLLVTARRRLGLSQRDLGGRLGVDPSAILKWEKGALPRNTNSWQRLEPMFQELDLGRRIRCELWPARYRRARLLASLRCD